MKKYAKKTAIKPLTGDRGKCRAKVHFSDTHVCIRHTNLSVRTCGALSLPVPRLQWTQAKCPLLQFSPNAIKVEGTSDPTG